MNRIFILFAFVLVFAVAVVTAQSPAEQIYTTERAFEKAVAEKGMNAAFIEFMAADGVMFLPDVVNARQHFASGPRSTAYLTWNPEIIDVSSNGVLAYSIGNSIFRPAGKDDANAYNGHYISVWRRDPDGQYRAVLDTGINHKLPGVINTQWRGPAGTPDPNAGRVSGADSSTDFFAMAAGDAGKAYGRFLADDAVALREGIEPVAGREQIRSLIGKSAGTIKFAKRKSFLEAGDLSYVHAPYSIVDKSGREIEKGNFVQVWKFRKGAWRIVADAQVPLPSK